MEDQESTSMIKGVSLGTIKPGDTVSRSLYLVNRHGVGDRTLDVSITSHAVTKQSSSSTSSDTDGDEDEDDESTTSGGDTKVSTEEKSPSRDVCETLRTVVVPALQPFSSTTETSYQRPSPSGQIHSLFDLDAGSDLSRSSVTATVVTSIVNVGPWEVEILKLEWVTKESVRLNRQYITV